MIKKNSNPATTTELATVIPTAFATALCEDDDLTGGGGGGGSTGAGDGEGLSGGLFGEMGDDSPG